MVPQLVWELKQAWRVSGLVEELARMAQVVVLVLESVFELVLERAVPVAAGEELPAPSLPAGRTGRRNHPPKSEEHRNCCKIYPSCTSFLNTGRPHPRLYRSEPNGPPA